MTDFDLTEAGFNPLLIGEGLAILSYWIDKDRREIVSIPFSSGRVLRFNCFSIWITAQLSFNPLLIGEGLAIAPLFSPVSIRSKKVIWEHLTFTTKKKHAILSINLSNLHEYYAKHLRAVFIHLTPHNPAP